MKTQPPTHFTAYCTAEGADVKVADDVALVVDALKRYVAARLQKKGVTVAWQPDPENAQLSLRLTRIDRSNQFLRCVPFGHFFGAPCVAVEGQLSLPDAGPVVFRYERVSYRTWYWSGWGGSAEIVLATCCKLLARDIAKSVHQCLEGAQILKGLKDDNA